MTIDEAIIHAKDTADHCDRSTYDGYRCAKEHEQLAKWLTELKAVYDAMDGLNDYDEIFVGYLRKVMKDE